MIFPLIIALVFFTSILSATAAPYLSIFNFAPDILFIELLILSLSGDYRKIMVYNFFAAIFYGFLSGLPLTASILPFFISLSFFNLLFRYYFGEFNFPILTMYAILSFFAFKLLSVFFLYLENYSLLIGLLNITTLKLILMQTIYNYFLVILIFVFLEKLKIAKPGLR